MSRWWLVEQQHVGLLQQDLRQFYTHAPTTRELRGGAIEVCPLEAQAHECAFQLCLSALGTHHHVALVFRGVFLYQCQIALTLIVCALSQFLVHLVKALLHPGDVGKGLLGLLSHRRIVLQDHHLRQIADMAVGRYTDDTCRRLLLSTEYLQHRRFTSSVLSHQGNAVAVVDHKTGVNEQGLHPEFHLQSFYRNHRLSTNT